MGFDAWPPEVKIISEHAEVGGGRMDDALALFDSGASDARSEAFNCLMPAVLVETGPTRRLVDLDGFGLNV